MPDALMRDAPMRRLVEKMLAPARAGPYNP
jgi:hypothetical protein